jgi:uncharacterized iron-regulated membrane protein
MMQHRFRKSLVIIHRWVGIGIALLILFQSLSGMFLSFGPEIDRALNPDLLRTSATASKIDPFEGAELAERAFPGYEIYGFSLHVLPGEALEVGLQKTSNPRELFRYAYVDLTNGRVVGSRFDGGSFDRRGIVRMIALLHADLMLGNVGAWILGIVSIFWIIMALAGFWLTMPLRRRNFGKVWRLSWKWPKRPVDRRYFYTAHRAIGLWSMPLVLVAAVTSFFLTLGEPVGKPLLSVIGPIKELYQPPPTGPELADGPIEWREAAARARAVIKGPASPREIHFEDESGSYRVFFLTPSDFHTDGRTIVDVNKLSGTTEANLPSEGNGLDIFLAWQIPLHTGHLFGEFYRYVVAFGGLAATMLVLAGILSWVKGRRRKLKL